MKHPLSRAQSIGRELVCFVAGHNWKSSWHRNEVPLDADETYEDIPYRLRQVNPFWENSAGWTAKCRRCRERIRGDGWQPFYVDYYRAIKASCLNVRSAWEFRKDESIPIKSKGWFVVWCGMEGVSHFFMHICLEHRLPMFLMDAACDVTMYAGDRAFTDGGTL